MLTSDLVANAVVSMYFLTLLTALGGVVAFGVFGVLATAALVFVHVLAPETKGATLRKSGTSGKAGHVARDVKFGVTVGIDIGGSKTRAVAPSRVAG